MRPLDRSSSDSQRSSERPSTSQARGGDRSTRLQSYQNWHYRVMNSPSDEASTSANPHDRGTVDYSSAQYWHSAYNELHQAMLAWANEESHREGQAAFDPEQVAFDQNREHVVNNQATLHQHNAKRFVGDLATKVSNEIYTRAASLASDLVDEIDGGMDRIRLVERIYSYHGQKVDRIDVNSDEFKKFAELQSTIVFPHVVKQAQCESNLETLRNRQERGESLSQEDKDRLQRMKQEYEELERKGEEIVRQQREIAKMR